ncbi:hypothetical protein PLESTF_001658400 [Pleodorina starrii]|nr:hypothetical protein PLESTM_001621200 [Pleodorina starrii]GLC75570.1 hypothetical protein PLESTF_001658400 [Pleodorina starrii]
MRSSTLFVLAWSRQLAYKSTDALNAFWKIIRQVHGLPAALPEVSAEAAGAAARRSVPLVRVPTNVEHELETVLSDRGVKPKEARRLGLELTERLKSLSHTPQRGGVGPHSTRPAPIRGGRLRGAELLAAREAFEAGELLSMDDRAVNAALGLPPPLRDDERHAPQMQKLVPKYKTEAEVMAYIVARLAPEYAVCCRVLDEAARLLEAADAAPAAAEAAGASGPKWRPREALIHGAGVGAAVVAALEACTSPSLTRIVALETSSMRQRLGTRLEQAHRASLQQLEDEPLFGEAAGGGLGRQGQARDRRARRQQAAGPVVSWVQALPPLSKAATAQRRRYDLVIAPYQLTVLPTVEERQRLVRELWDRCGDVLVLVEPGTPRGFAVIAEARELVLSREGRKRAQLEAAAAGAYGGAQPGGGDSATDPRVIGKLKGAGAHVVAPCPHDGICPMLASKRNWCHFSQPLLLPAFMQQAMVLPADKAHGRARALNLQDERFSYVILRRGPRPSLRVAVARDFDTTGGDFGDGARGAGPVGSASLGAVPSRLPPRVVLSQVMLNRAATASATAVGPSGDVAVATAAASAGGAASQRAAQRRTPLFSSQPPADTAVAALGGSTPDPGVPSTVTTATTAKGLETPPRPPVLDAAAGGGSEPAAPSLGAGVEVVRGPATAAFARKYPAFGPGLVGRLIVLQDAGVDWSTPGDDQRDDEAPEEAGVATGRGPRAVVDDADMRHPRAGQPPPPHVSATAAAAAAATAPMAAPAAAPVARRGGDSSSRSPGLDAAVAELSFSMLGGAPAPATGSPRAEAQELDPLALPPSPPWPGAAEVSELEAEPEVSKAEYEVAERQLVERIYGAEAARAWLAGGGAGASGGGGAYGATAALDQIDDADLEEQEEEEQEEAEDIAGAAAVAAGRDRSLAAMDGQGPALATRAGAWEDAEAEAEEGEEQEEAELAERQATPASAATRRFAEASSFGWGRLVRSPRLRGGHVILDMCVGPQHHYPDSPPGAPEQDAEGAPADADAVTVDPCTAAAEAAGGLQRASAASSDGVGGIAASGGQSPSSSGRPEGRLVQQVVAKSARRGWMGAPAYRLARRLSWGDCWPDWYIRSHNVREAAAPRAAAGANSEPAPRLGVRR